MDLANDVPTINEPTNPGPFVNAIADKSDMFILASSRVFFTTGSINF